VFPTFAADTLLTSDFKGESWAKTIDFFDYARASSVLNGMTAPNSSSHAYVYMTYVDTRGLQMLYAGLRNITFDGLTYFTVPMQTFMMHYKTSNRTRDILLTSTFLMLLAFNETSNSIYPNSPDVNDNLWASLSFGLNLSKLNATLPVLNSKTEIIPLTHSTDNLTWSWGMKYTNLTALWWRTWIDPVHPHFDSSGPMAITVYDELAFTYNLTINPTTHTATLTENHVIGRMRQLLVKWLPLLWVHYNSTGEYFLGAKISNETIYDFLQKNQIKMSVVNFQTTIVADHETYSKTPGGQNVTNTDASVSGTSIGTYTDDGEKICNASFGTKKTYKLYNYTADPTEISYKTYNATARTANAAGFAGNAELLKYQIGLMKYLPLLVADMHPQLFQEAKDSITNMTRASYFYLIAYPTYSGYRVVHDPTFTIYLDTSTATATINPYLGPILIIVAIAAAATAGVLFKRRRKSEGPQAQPELQTGVQQ
jgi:hypothetical protein